MGLVEANVVGSGALVFLSTMAAPIIFSLLLPLLVTWPFAAEVGTLEQGFILDVPVSWSNRPCPAKVAGIVRDVFFTPDNSQAKRAHRVQTQSGTFGDFWLHHRIPEQFWQ